MDTQTTDTAVLEALHALQTSMQAQQALMQIQQTSILALQSSVDLLRDGQAALRADVAAINMRLDLMTEHYATKANVESVRSELYRAINAQTLKLLTTLTAMCSGLVAITFYIARYVH